MKSEISENVVLYDWVTISCKEEDPQILIDLLGMKNFSWEPMQKGMNGYKQGLFYNNITVLYDGLSGMGTCLNLSGQGCRAFESYGTGDFDELFSVVLNNSDLFHITRLDVAFDDHTGILDIDRLFRDCDAGEYVSKFRKAKIEKEFNDEKPGITVYHGSKKSEVLLRIYDKAAERGYEDGRHWIRVELQLRDDRALAFISADAPIGEKMRGVLLNYVRYVDPDPADTNRWRWPMKDYWAALIGAVGKIMLYVKPGLEYNIMQLHHYVFDQAGNAIEAMIDILGYTEFQQKLKTRGTQGNPKYERLVSEYGRKKRE